MTDPQNPFLYLVETFRLSRTDLAAALSVPYGTLCDVLAGVKPAPASLLEAVDALGYDAEDFRREYSAWRAWRRAQQHNAKTLAGVACA